MGLSFKQSKANWSYSGFNNFRERLAREIGINLSEMTGFSDRKYPDPKRGYIPWHNVTDAIRPFLNHSDCGDELSPEECAQVAPRLRELVAHWGFENYDRINALILAADMEKCAARNEALVFC